MDNFVTNPFLDIVTNMYGNAQLSENSQQLESDLANQFRNMVNQSQQDNSYPKASKNILDEQIKERQADRDLKIRSAEYKLQQKLADERMQMLEKDKRDWLGKMLMIDGMYQDRGYKNPIPMTAEMMPTGSYKAAMQKFPDSTLNTMDAKVREDTLNAMAGLDNADLKAKLYGSLITSKGKSMPKIPGSSKGTGNTMTGQVTNKDIWKDDNTAFKSFKDNVSKLNGATVKDNLGRDILRKSNPDFAVNHNENVLNEVSFYADSTIANAITTAINMAKSKYGNDKEKIKQSVIKQFDLILKRYKGNVPARYARIRQQLPTILNSMNL